MTGPRPSPALRPGLLAGILVAAWVIVLVLAPLAALVTRSFETVEANTTAVARELDHLAAELAVVRLRWDDTADPEQRADLDRRIRMLAERAQRLEQSRNAEVADWGLDAYRRLAGTGAAGIARTFALAALATGLSLVIAYPVAFATARRGHRRAVPLFALLLVACALPEPWRRLAWSSGAESGPLATLLATIGLPPLAPGSNIADVGEALFVGLPLAFLPLHLALGRLDPAEIEAARDLGASTPRLHWRIVRPRIRRALALAAVATFAVAVGSASPLLLPSAPPEMADAGLVAASGVALAIGSLVVALLLIRILGPGARDLLRRRA